MALLFKRSKTTKLILLDSLLQEVVHIAPPRLSEAPGAYNGQSVQLEKEPRRSTLDRLVGESSRPRRVIDRSGHLNQGVTD